MMVHHPHATERSRGRFEISEHAENSATVIWFQASEWVGGKDGEVVGWSRKQAPACSQFANFVMALATSSWVVALTLTSAVALGMQLRSGASGKTNLCLLDLAYPDTDFTAAPFRSVKRALKSFFGQWNVVPKSLGHVGQSRHHMERMLSSLRCEPAAPDAIEVETFFRGRPGRLDECVLGLLCRLLPANDQMPSSGGSRAARSNAFTRGQFGMD